jgi:hypothetical protein
MQNSNEELARRAKNFFEQSDQSRNQRTMGQIRREGTAAMLLS